MASVELEKLLRNISDGQPCGEDLWLTGISGDFEAKARAKPENWPSLRDACTELISSKSKDLRAAVYLALAMLGSEGIQGFNDGLSVIRQMLDQHWDHLYPRHVAGQDPPKRVMILEWMTPRGSDALKFRTRLRTAPLTRGGDEGEYGLRDLEYANGKVSPPEGVSAPSVDKIEAAFAKTPLEYLKAVASSASGAMEQLKTISELLSKPERAGAAPQLAELHDILTEIHQEASTRAAAAEPVIVTIAPIVEGPTGDRPPGERSGTPAIDGAIRSDRDVLLALDRICEYYRRTQPSSPMPLLLERAKKWVGVGFLDLLDDLNLNVKDQLQQVIGKAPDKG